MERTLNREQREKMFVKRGMYRLDFMELAEILNAKREHMVQAQIGKPIPAEVADAVIRWIES